MTHYALFGLALAFAAPAWAIDASNVSEFQASPDFHDTNGPDSLTPAAPGATNAYLRVAGSSFLPRDSDTTVTYASSGCVRVGGTQHFLAADLQLPQGATILYVRTYFYNQGVSGNMTTFLTSYDGQGAFTDYTSFATSTSAGYDSILSPAINQVVDNTGLAYVVNATVSADNANLRFCGIRVNYSY